jgi:putative transposase
VGRIREMKRKRLTEEQIVGTLKEHEAEAPVTELCCIHGVSDASICKWKAKHGGLEVSYAKRLKKLLAEAIPDITMLKDLDSEKCQRPLLSGKPWLIL